MTLAATTHQTIDVGGIRMFYRAAGRKMVTSTRTSTVRFGPKNKAVEDVRRLPPATGARAAHGPIEDITLAGHRTRAKHLR
jgi:hypothetical protein